MKKNLILVLVCLFLVSLTVGCGSSDSKKEALKTFTPEGKNFSADFPGEPTLDSSKINSPYGEVATDSYTFQGKYSMLSVSSTVLPDELLAQDHDTILTNSANGAVASTNGANPEFADITVLEQPAKSYKFSIKTPDDGTFIIKGHVVIIDKTLYALQYSNNEKNWDKYQEERDAFFDSFKIN